MIQLRPYQLDGVNNIREAFRTNKRVLYVAPTGSGKTVQFAYICAKAIEKGSTVLVLSHRIEIFKQNLKAVSNYTKDICLIDGDNKRIDGQAKLFVGMVETFKRRIKLFADVKFDLIICDEAHTQTYYSIFDAFPDVKVLGVTGSPVGKKLHLYYDTIVESIGIPELIEQGFLCRCLGYEMRDDFSDLKTDSSGEFTDKSNFEHFSKAKIFDGLIEKYLEKCIGKKTLIFCVNIEHSEQTVRAFKAAGITAYSLTSETSDSERERILREYGHTFHVLVNANILNSGFDDPSIEVVIFNRATSSLIFWLQGCGRGSRPFINKANFMVIDFGGNFSRLGLWSQERNWTLEPPKNKKKGLGAAPIRSCAGCGAMLPAQQRKCEYCGYQMTDKEKELLKGELVEVKQKGPPPVPSDLVGLNVSECSIEQLIQLEVSKVLKSPFVWRILRSRGEPDIITYANLKGYKNGWTHRQVMTMLDENEAVGKVEFRDFKVRASV